MSLYVISCFVPIVSKRRTKLLLILFKRRLMINVIIPILATILSTNFLIIVDFLQKTMCKLCKIRPLGSFKYFKKHFKTYKFACPNLKKKYHEIVYRVMLWSFAEPIWSVWSDKRPVELSDVSSFLLKICYLAKYHLNRKQNFTVFYSS